MTERERLVRLKLNHGRRRVDELVAAVQAFWHSSPHRVEFVVDLVAKQRQWVLRLPNEPPLGEWALLVGDATHNLRVALGHLVCRLVEANGGTVTKDHMFPIAESDSIYKGIVCQRLRGVSQPARAAIGELRPWRGGNDALWLLHRLDIQDKHRLPLVTLPAHEHVSLDFGRNARARFPDLGEIPSMRLALRPSDRDISDGGVLFAGPLDDVTLETLDPQFQLEIDLRLPDDTRRPLGGVLPELAAAVDAAISALAAHLV